MDKAKSQTDVTAGQEITRSFLALGDSYTIGESVDPNARWPVQLADSLVRHGLPISPPDIIATTGWRTDELQDAIDNYPKGTYDLVSLLIGVNDQFQKKQIEDYPGNFEKLLKTAIMRAAGDPGKVFVVSIPDYGFTPFGQPNQPTISEELDEYNDINKSIAEKHGVKYFYITDLSRQGIVDPGLVASDNLHPSGAQYSLWVKRIISDKKWVESLF